MTTGTILLFSLCAMQSSRAADDVFEKRVPMAMEREFGRLPAMNAARAPTMELRIEMTSPASTPANTARLGGATAAGRVTAVYVRLGQGLFLSIERAPSTIRNNAERWVEVQFPHALENGVAEAPAYVNDTHANVEVGDAVEIRFAHPERSRVFPVPEVTRVTAVIAKSHEPLARLYQKRIDERLEDDASRIPSQLEWLVRTSTHSMDQR
jgi:hypothetical protein